MDRSLGTNVIRPVARLPKENVLYDWCDGVTDVNHRLVHVAGSDSLLPFDGHYPKLDALSRLGCAVRPSPHVQRKVVIDHALPAATMRAVGVIHALPFVVAPTTHNVRIAIKYRMEDSIKPADPVVLATLRDLLREFATQFPKAVYQGGLCSSSMEFNVRTVEDWITRSNYPQSKQQVLRAAWATLRDNPSCVRAHLALASFLKIEVGFKNYADDLSGRTGLFKPRVITNPNAILKVFLGPFFSSLQRACSARFTTATPFAMYLNTSSLEVGAWARRCQLHLSRAFIEGDATNFDGSQCKALVALIIEFYESLGATTGHKDTIIGVLQELNNRKLSYFNDPECTIMETEGTNISGIDDTTLKNNIVNFAIVTLAFLACLPESIRSRVRAQIVSNLGKPWDECEEVPLAVIVAGDDNLICVHDKYRQYVSARGLSATTSAVGMTYNFIDRATIATAEFVSSIFIPVNLAENVMDHTGTTVLSPYQCAGESFAIVSKPARVFVRGGWTTANEISIPDSETRRYYGEKAYGILQGLPCHVPVLTDYLSAISGKFYDPTRAMLRPNDNQYKNRHHDTGRNAECLVENAASRDTLWVWFETRYGISPSEADDFIAKFRAKLCCGEHESWFLSHPVLDMMASIDL